MTSRLIVKVLALWLALMGDSYAYRIVTSIIPLESLASYLLEGIADPKALLDGFESAHTYTLRPSDLEKLNQADMIIWLGPSYEGFLSKAIAASQKPTLQVLEIPDLNLLPLREQGKHHHHHEGHVKSDKIDKDPHIWLDPQRCKKVLVAMHQAFLNTFPADKVKLDENLKNSLQAFDHLYKDLKKKFLPLQTKPFMVYHDGYQYLEEAFNLKNVGTVVSHPELPLTLQDRKRFIDLTKVYPHLCVFLESQFSPKVLENLARDFTFKTATLDPIGIGLEGKPAYSTLMNTLAIAMNRCLTP